MPVDEIVAPAAAVETPAPVVTPDAAPVTPAAPAVETTNLDPEAKLRDAIGKSMDQTPGFEVTKPAVVVPAVKTPEELAAEKKLVDDKAVADKAAAEALKTPEQKLAEQKIVDDKAAAEALKLKENPPNPLDSLGPLPVATLAKAINDNPELAAQLEKVGIDPEVLYETSRRAAKTDQYEAIFPTPDAAQFADASAKNFYKIEEGFPKITDVKSFDEFLVNTMLPLSQLIDENGNPLMSADGKTFQTDGSIERFLTSAVQYDTIGALNAVDRLEKAYAGVAGEEGEELRAEVSRVKEAFMVTQSFRDNGGKIGPKAGAGNNEVPAAVKAELEKLRAENADASKVKTDAAKAQDSAFQSSISAEVGTSGQAFVERTLNLTSLNDNEKRFIAQQAVSEALATMTPNTPTANAHYLQQKNHLYNLGRSDQNKQKIVALGKTTFELAVTKSLSKLVAEAGGKTLTKQEQRQQKQDTQSTNDRMNQGGGATAAAKAAPVLTSAQVRAKAIENFKADPRNRGEMPDDGQILQETLKIRGF